MAYDATYTYVIAALIFVAVFTLWCVFGRYIQKGLCSLCVAAIVILVLAIVFFGTTVSGLICQGSVKPICDLFNLASEAQKALDAAKAAAGSQ